MKKLVIFNLQTDSSSVVLGASIDWINELRNHFAVTDVVSTHVGPHDGLDNLRIIEIGGGSIWYKLIALIRLLRFSIYLIPRRNEYLVFHHMSPRTAVFPGILFKIFGIPQGLWYSHSSRPISLQIAARIVNWIFSSEADSLPLKSRKAYFVGHGISLNRFNASRPILDRDLSILFLGRLSKIKNLDNLVNAVAKLKNRITVVLVGPQSDKRFAENLKQLASRQNVRLEIEDAIGYNQVNRKMNQFKYFYSGMKNSVDKSALEAAISGCLVISTENGTLHLSGMRKAWDEFQLAIPNSIQGQIMQLEGLKNQDISLFQQIAQADAISKNGIEKTIHQIAKIMKSPI